MGHMLLTCRIWCHYRWFFSTTFTSVSILIQIIVGLMWTLHLIFHFRYIFIKIILHYLLRIIDTLFIINLVILRNFGVFFTYWLFWRLNSVILHTLGKIFVRKIIIALNGASLSWFFLLSKLKFTLIRLVAFINRHSTMLWKLGLLFFFIIYDGSSFDVNVIGLRRSFLFEITLSMNLFDNFLVIILNLFDFSFKVLEFLMQ